MRFCRARFRAGVKMVTVAVSAPVLNFLERVRVGCGRKGKVLGEVRFGELGLVWADLKCEEIYSLSKGEEKKEIC